MAEESKAAVSGRAAGAGAGSGAGAGAQGATGESVGLFERVKGDDIPRWTDSQFKKAKNLVITAWVNLTDDEFSSPSVADWRKWDKKGVPTTVIAIINETLEALVAQVGPDVAVLAQALSGLPAPKADAGVLKQLSDEINRLKIDSISRFEFKQLNSKVTYLEKDMKRSTAASGSQTAAKVVNTALVVNGMNMFGGKDWHSILAEEKCVAEAKSSKREVDVTRMKDRFRTFHDRHAFDYADRHKSKASWATGFTENERTFMFNSHTAARNLPEIEYQRQWGNPFLLFVLCLDISSTRVNLKLADTHKHHTINGLSPDVTLFDVEAGDASEGSARGFVDFVSKVIDNEHLYRVATKYCQPVLCSQPQIKQLWCLVMSPKQVKVLRVRSTSDEHSKGWLQISSPYPVVDERAKRVPPETMALLRCFMKRVTETSQAATATVALSTGSVRLHECIGRGNSGNVYKGTWRAGDEEKPCAVKLVQRTEPQKQQYAAEQAVLEAVGKLGRSDMPTLLASKEFLADPFSSLVVEEGGTDGDGGGSGAGAGAGAGGGPRGDGTTSEDNTSLKYSMLVMYPVGESLRQGPGERFSLAWFFDLVTQLRTLHALNFLHMDVRPSNFIVVGGSLMLIDFGCALQGSRKNGTLQVTIAPSTYSGTLRTASASVLTGLQGDGGFTVTQADDLESACRSVLRILGTRTWDIDGDLSGTDASSDSKWSKVAQVYNGVPEHDRALAFPFAGHEDSDPYLRVLRLVSSLYTDDERSTVEARWAAFNTGS